MFHTFRRLHPQLLLAGLCLLAFAPPILGLFFGWWPLGEDALAYFAPLRGWAASELRQGVLPLWNPYLFCGQSFAGNIQSGLWYPPNFVYWLLPERFALLADALGHAIWLAWGGFFFARALRISHSASLLAAVLLALGGATAARIYAGQTIWLAAFAHLPWLLRAELVYLRGGQARDAAYAGAWLGLIILAGHPPTALLAALLGCGLLALWLVTRQREEQKMPRGWPLVLCASAALCLSLSAAAWLPFRELSKLAEHGGALSFSDATVLSGTWKSFVRLVAPDWFGGNRGVQWSQACCAHEEAASIGVLPFVLAFASLFLLRSTVEFDRTPFDRTSRALRCVWLALPIVLLLALGASTPFYGWLFDALPPLRLLRAPSRWLLVWAFVAPFLAALVWQRLMNANSEKPAQNILVLLRAVALLFAAVAAWVLLSPENIWHHAAAPFAHSAPGMKSNEVAANFRRVALLESATVFLLAGLAASLVQRWRHADARTKPRMTHLLLGFACLECVLGFWRGAKLVSPGDQADALWPRAIVARHTPDERWTTSIFWQGINRATTEKVPLANGYDPLGTKNYFAFASAAEGRKFWETLYQPARRSALWRVAGVTHTLAQTPDPLDGDTPYPDTRGWKLETKSGRWELWNRNEQAWPRVYLAADVWKTADALPLLQSLAMQERGVFPVVMAPTDLPGVLSQLRIGSAPLRNGTARIVSESPNRIVIENQAARATALVVNDANYPGWRAWSNGVATPVVTANGMFRAVAVPRGRAKTEMIFEPQSVRVGIFLSLCGLFALTAMMQVRSKSTVLRSNHESDTNSTTG